jgi:hypothetical protein
MFASRSVHVGFVVDKVALGQVFLLVLRFCPVSIILPLLHIHSFIIWGVDSGPVSGRISAETQSHPVDPVDIIRMPTNRRFLYQFAATLSEKRVQDYTYYLPFLPCNIIINP